MSFLVVGAIVAAAGVPAAVASGYLFLLAVAGSRLGRRVPTAAPKRRLTVLIPAHNEAELIGECVASVRRQTYPHDLFRVVVVADNCADRTAVLAAGAGAEVMVRDVPELTGKGHALHWALDRILKANDAPDAIVVVDADSLVDPDFLVQLEGEMGAGREVLQADDLLQSDGSDVRGRLGAVALLLRNRVRFAGRAVLGMPASLCGNGMLLSSRVLRDHPWDAFSGTEDGEYSLRLREAGIATYFAPGAHVYAATNGGGRGAYSQGLRWERGRFELMRGWVYRLLVAAWRRREWDLLNTAFDLAIPPLGILAAGSALGLVLASTAAGLGMIPAWSAIPWLAATGLLPAYVLAALIVNRAPLTTYAALLAVPWFMFLKLRVYAGLLGRTQAGQWVRTQRPSEAEGSRLA